MKGNDGREKNFRPSHFLRFLTILPKLCVDGWFFMSIKVANTILHRFIFEFDDFSSLCGEETHFCAFLRGIHYFAYATEFFINFSSIFVKFRHFITSLSIWAEIRIFELIKNNFSKHFLGQNSIGFKKKFLSILES